MLQRRRFFSNNSGGDYVFIDGIQSIVGQKSGSYIETSIPWSDDLILEMIVSTPPAIGTSSPIYNLFCSTPAGAIEGPTVTLSGKRPPYQKTISFMYNGTVYSEQNDNIPENLTKTLVKLTNSYLTIGSYTYNINNPGSIQRTVYIQIFGKSTKTAFQQGVIHNVKITTDSQIYNLVPCYHKNNPNVGLLYDEVRNEVYESSNPNYPFTPYDKGKQ